MDRYTALLTVIAIVAITVLEILAMHYGINGALFSLVIAAIAGLAGYELRKRQSK